jgi:glycosyltransferase involved in cell wall biosynthesis
MVMFPLQPGGDFTRTYDHFVCNSAYTEYYTRKRWGDALRTTVVHPTPSLSAVPSAARERMILSIGRFNWRGHPKNQDILVEAFDDVVDLLPRGWRLVLVGKVNEDPLTSQKMEALRRRCRRLPVSFELDCTESRKRELLARSSLFWHGTGLGYREAEYAERMEHFGIAIVEAMCAGSIPLCYSHGGPLEIVEHAQSGFLFRDPEELKTFTLLLAGTPALQEQMRPRAIARGMTFAHPAPERQLSGFLGSVVAA